jgi:hypothetical protein
MKVLYSSAQYLMLYRCDVIMADKSCSPDGVYAAILGRSHAEVNYTEVASVYAQVNQHCFMVGDIMRTNLEG